MKEKIHILKTPESISKEYIPFRTEEETLQALIDSFTRVLEQKLSKNNLKLFYNNISTIRIENKRIILEKILGIFKDNTITGQYYLEDNTISILPINKYTGITTKEYIINLYHELLHMSSTIVDKERKIVFSGLSQISNIGIGVALDDGYTELLLFRYFNLDKKYISYTYEVVITSLIEEIVGTNEMTNHYFTANLFGLIKELAKYNTRENIEKFLEDLDSIYVLQDHSRKYQKDIIYYHNEVSNFLVTTYLNKLKDELKNGKITNANYDIKLDKYLEKVHIAFEKLEIEKKKYKQKWH